MLRSDQPRSDQPCAPFLRWAGSKRRILPALQKFWHSDHKRYIEPFAGSACLFFSLRPHRAILGDLNRELVATYLELKYRVEHVINALAGLRPGAAQFHRLRALDPAALKPSDRAARFIYLNRFCFNGLYRTNLRGQFNVPYSGDRCGQLPSPDLLRLCSRLIKRARLISGDFARVLECALPGDLVYMDPPFAIRERRVFREYDPNTFTVDDIPRLRTWMEKLDAAGVTFVVSYAESDEANVLRRGFSSQVVSVRRNIAGFSAHRSNSNEVIISNSLS